MLANDAYTQRCKKAGLNIHPRPFPLPCRVFYQYNVFSQSNIVTWNIGGTLVKLFLTMFTQPYTSLRPLRHFYTALRIELVVICPTDTSRSNFFKNTMSSTYHYGFLAYLNLLRRNSSGTNSSVDAQCVFCSDINVSALCDHTFVSYFQRL